MIIIPSCSRYSCDLCVTFNLFLYKIILSFDLSCSFDSLIFKSRFVDLVLPSVVDKDGPTFLFGDNLESHFSSDLIKLVNENSIYFVMLPIIATNYSTCRYLVQLNGNDKKFWINGDKKHDEPAIFLKKYFIYFLRN